MRYFLMPDYSKEKPITHIKLDHVDQSTELLQFHTGAFTKLLTTDGDKCIYDPVNAFYQTIPHEEKVELAGSFTIINLHLSSVTHENQLENEYLKMVEFLREDLYGKFQFSQRAKKFLWATYGTALMQFAIAETKQINPTLTMCS